MNLNITSQSEECEQLKKLSRQLRDRCNTSSNVACSVSQKEAEKIRNYASGIERILKAESRQVFVYEVDTPQRLDAEMLINRVDSFFEPGVFEYLPPIARWDFGEAAKALAFKLPMAAAMLSFRACEAVLRGYYFLLCDKKPGQRVTFGQLRDQLQAQLEQLGRFRKKQDVLDELASVVRKRNRTIHLEKQHDIWEAEALFTGCVDACSQMIKDLEPDMIERDQSDLLKRLISEETQSILFEWIRTVDLPVTTEGARSG